MIYSHEVEMMCPVAQGANHGPAPIPEEAKWVKAKEIKDISGLTHGVGSVSYTHLLPVTDTHRMVTTGGHFAYLKIAEGCDKHCTYCIIPKVRGDFRSVPVSYTHLMLL